MLVHQCNVLFLNQKFFLSIYLSTHPPPPLLIFLLWGIYLECYTDGAINNRTKGQWEKVRQLIEERNIFLKVLFTILVFLFHFAEHLSWSKTSQTEGENHKSMIFPSFHFSFPPFQLSLQQLCQRSSLSDFQLTDSSLNISSLKIQQYLSLWRFHFSSWVMIKTSITQTHKLRNQIISLISCKHQMDFIQMF